MSQERTIARHTALQSVGKLLGLVLALMSAGLLFPYLGEVGVGQYTAVLSLLQIFGILMDLGLYIILIKRLAVIDDATPAHVNNIVTMRITAGIVCMLLAPLTAWVIGQFNDFYNADVVWATMIASVFFFAISMNQLLSAIFQKWFATQWIAVGELVGKVALIGMTLLVIGLNLNIIWAMSTLSVSAGVNFLIMWLSSRKYISIRLAFDWAMWKSTIKEAWPIGVSIAFALLYFKGDAVILSFYTDSATLGQYGAPYKILEVLVTFPAIFTGLVLPILTAAWQSNNRERLRSLIQRSFDMLVLVALPMVAATWALSPYMIDLLVKDGFRQSSDVLNILIIATACIYVATLFGYIVPALDKQRTMMWGYIGVALTSLAGYLFFIPLYSLRAAAWVTVYSEAMVLLIAVWIVLRTTQTKLRYSTLIKAVICAGLLYSGLVWLIPQCVDILHQFSWINALSVRWFAGVVLLIMVPIGFVWYALWVLACGIVTIQDVKQLVVKRKL